MKLRELKCNGYERVIRADDDSAEYHSVIAIHNTRLGPAVGGTRLWRYDSEEDALHDCLRLARGMTFKSAFAGLPLGGGKSVIMSPANEKLNREELFRAHGRLIDKLAGSYITAEDVGTTTTDMEWVHSETGHVAGLKDRSGDPSAFTARGVLRGMEASAKHYWGSEDLNGRTVILQGCGN